VTETEVKILNIDPAGMRSKLTSLRAKHVKSVRQHNEVYKSAEHKGITARIRKEGAVTIFTMKAKAQRIRGMKVVEEHELTVSDERELRRMLQLLGFKIARILELDREYYALCSCSVEICRIPGLPAYLEIEGKRKDIMAAAKQLGISPQRFDARSVSKIFRLGKKTVF
jgi:predicted adenylyl cyclase CyaB